MSLDVIIGGMFSGKSSELIRILKRSRAIGKKILVVNSSKDTRSPEDVLRTHDNVVFNCVKVARLQDLTGMPGFHNSEVIAIDEAQFFTDLREYVQGFVNAGKEVIVAGLDGDFRQRKFGEILECIPIADRVTKLTALCMSCRDGTPGPFTQRTINSDELELIGDSNMYRAVCRSCLTRTSHPN
jgi:thymidine kinase